MRRLATLLVLAAPLLAQEPLTEAEGLPSADVRALCVSGERVWAATARGLCLIEAHRIRVIPGVPDARALLPAPNGEVYVLGGEKLVIVGPEGPRAPDRAPPVQPAPAREIVFRGQVWTIAPGVGITRRYETPPAERWDIPGANRVNALALGADGAVWCGTENGVARVSEGGLETFPTVDGKALGTVTSVAVDRAGRVWIGSGSSFRGVFRLEEGAWRKVPGLDGYVHRITADAAGALWFAVLEDGQDEGRGAWIFRDERFARAPGTDDLPSTRVYDVVARDPSGVLWFATLKGLAAYDGGSTTHYTARDHGLPGDKVWCVHAARDGSLWLGYQKEAGVSRLAGGSFTHHGTGTGLCDGGVWSIAEGSPGVLWFATQAGLGRYDGVRWSCFDRLAQAALWPLLPLPDGSLWIGTLGDGLLHFRPSDDDPPRTRFVDPRRSWPEGATVTLRWTGVDAWFDTPARDLCYRWRLDDERWSYAAPATSVQLLGPAPGRHRLQVQAIDPFGNAEDPPAEFVFHVATDRGSWWMLLGLGVAVAAAALILLRRGRSSAARAT